jgi:hypothetical protein
VIDDRGHLHGYEVLQRPGITFSLAVLSTHDPSMRYGEQTIAGVTERLLGRAR